MRIISGLSGAILFCLLVAAIQTTITPFSFFRSFLLDLCALACLLTVVTLLIRAVVNQWPWESL